MPYDKLKDPRHVREVLTESFPLVTWKWYCKPPETVRAFIVVKYHIEWNDPKTVFKVTEWRYEGITSSHRVYVPTCYLLDHDPRLVIMRGGGKFWEWVLHDVVFTRGKREPYRPAYAPVFF